MARRESRATPPGSASGDPAGRSHVEQPAEAVGERPRRASQLAQLADLGAGHRHAAALGAIGEQGVALGLGGRGPLDGRVTVGLDARQPSPRRLGPVVGVARGEARLGELRPQVLELGGHPAGRPALLLDLPAELLDPRRELHQLGAGADRRLLGRLPPPLGPPQGGRVRRPRRGVVGGRHELGDAPLPALLAAQPLDADRVDQLGQGADGDAPAEVRVGLDRPPQRPERRRPGSAAA